MNKHDLKKLESEKRRRSSPSSLLSSDPLLEVQLAVLDVLLHLGFVLVVLQVFRDVRKLELVICRLKYWPQLETGNDHIVSSSHRRTELRNSGQKRKKSNQ